MKRHWRQPGHNLYQTKRWRRLRRQVLSEEPLCRMCQQVGKVTPSDTVDHIREHKGDKALFWDRANLQGLCHTCHDSAKQLKELHGFAPGVGADGLPIDPDHPWNKC